MSHRWPRDLRAGETERPRFRGVHCWTDGSGCLTDRDVWRGPQSRIVTRWRGGWVLAVRSVRSASLCPEVEILPTGETPAWLVCGFRIPITRSAIAENSDATSATIHEKRSPRS